MGGKKQRHLLCRADREPTWLAGIWSESARGVAAEFYSSMPLALDAESLAPWLDPHLTDRETIRQVVHHLPADLLTHRPVSMRMNKPTNDDAGLIEMQVN